MAMDNTWRWLGSLIEVISAHFLSPLLLAIEPYVKQPDTTSMFFFSSYLASPSDSDPKLCMGGCAGLSVMLRHNAH